MELVIDIPERTYEQIKFYAEMGIGTTVDEIVLNGTPLPKGHGRLIDADSFVQEHPLAFVRDVINDAPTIIEADGGEEE